MTDNIHSCGFSAGLSFALALYNLIVMERPGKALLDGVLTIAFVLAAMVLA